MNLLNEFSMGARQSKAAKYKLIQYISISAYPKIYNENFLPTVQRVKEELDVSLRLY